MKDSPEGRYRQRNPEWWNLQMRKHHLKKRYGITPEDYDRMLKKQRGRCAICGKPPKKNRLAVDHCHNTNKIRGLLCAACNRTLGWAEIMGLVKILKYLRRGE
jgi:hypothetical protein